MKQKPILNQREERGISYRSVSQDVKGAIDVDARTVRVAFSSDAMVEMGYGFERLSHDPSAVMLDFLNSGRAPVLYAHDNQIGVIEAGSVTNEGGKLRGTARLGRRQSAVDAFNDIQDEILLNTSVGYRVHQERVVRKSGDTPEHFFVTRWEPREFSFVPLPADRTVGVARKESIEPIKETKPMPDEVKKPVEQPAAAPERAAPAIDTRAIAADAQRAANDRVNKILDLTGRFGLESEARDFINSDKSFDDVREMVLAKVEARNAATNLEPVGHIDMSAKEEQRYSLSKAILASAGRSRGVDAGFELEISDEIARRTGQTPSGLLVPATALSHRTLLASGTNVGEDFIFTEEGKYIPPLFENSVIFNVGADFMPGLVGDVDMPADAAATAYALADDDTAITESTPASSKINLTPQGHGALVKYSMQLLKQATPSVDARVRANVRSTLLQHVQQTIITNVLGTAGIGAASSLGTDGGDPTWEMLNELVREVEVDNLEGNAFLTNPKVKYKLSVSTKVASTDSIMLLNGNDILGERTFYTNSVPSNLEKASSGTVLSALLYGDWSKLVIADWGAIDIAASDSAAATDFAKGHITIRALYYMDDALTYAAAISASKEIVTT